MALRRLLPALPAVIVVDGYVWLPDGRPGLGAHLYESLARCAAVVGTRSPRRSVATARRGRAGIAELMF